MDEFYEIAKKEATISEKQLLEAFRAIDINGDGFISAKEFITLFTSVINLEEINSKPLYKYNR